MVQQLPVKFHWAPHALLSTLFNHSDTYDQLLNLTMEDQCKKEQRDDKCIPLITTKLGNHDHMQGLRQGAEHLLCPLVVRPQC